MTDYYYKGLSSFTTGDIDFINDEIFAALINTDEYTVNLEDDKFLSDIPVLGILSTVKLSGKSSDVKGVMDSDDLNFVAVEGNGIIQAKAVVFYKKMNSNNESFLIAYVDEADEFPVTPDGSDVSIIMNDGANKVLSLKDFS